MSTSDFTVCVIVDKHAGRLAPSETFIKAHTERLPARTLTLLGKPLRRRTAEGRFLLSQRAPWKGWRWLVRQVGLNTVTGQDTAALKRFFRRRGVDLVLAEYGLTGTTVMEACRQTDVPLVVHFHGWDAYQLPRDADIRDAYSELFGIAAGMVVPSQHMRRQLIELGAPDEKVHVNVYGVRDIATPAAPERSDCLFTAVGRFTPKKAPFATLMAFAKTVRSVPEARLEMIGDGPLLEPSRMLATVLGIQDSVTFHGAAGHEQVFSLMSKSRCFVQHSVVAPNGDCEGTPVAVLEALTMGLPVVSTRHTGIAEVVREGVTGYLVDEYDLDGMAEAMIRYGRSPALAGEHGRAGRDDAAAWAMEESLSGLWRIIAERGTASPSRPRR